MRRNMRHLAYSWALSLLAMLATTSVSQAALVTYGFTNVTNNNITNVSIGRSQMTVDVTDDGMEEGFVEFIFRNAGPAASSITDVYFDDGSLLGITQVENGPGTQMTIGADPGNLPGGNAINFHTSTSRYTIFSADSSSQGGVQPNGANPGEWFGIIFALKNSKTYDDVLAALTLSLQPGNIGQDITGGLRIGIHVQGFANGGSESFVNSDPVAFTSSIVPEPASMTLWALGLVVCGGAGYWKKRRAKESA